MRTTEGVDMTDLCEYLHEKSLDTSWLDDECGSVDESGWFGRIGRHIISVSTVGFRYHSAFPTVAQAESEMDRLHRECDAVSAAN